jgi:outer membrane protein OmpA-like peptidoglycan-associated protein
MIKKTKWFSLIAIAVVAASAGGYLIYSGFFSEDAEIISDNVPSPGQDTVIHKGDTLKNQLSKQTNVRVQTGTNKKALYYQKLEGPGVQRINLIVKANADCKDAINITDSVLVCSPSLTGPGNSIEMNNNKPDDWLYFEKEHNTVWYKFTARESGNLTFDIIPFDQNDDYDFILYKYAGTSLCERVATKQVTPLRTCISRNDKKLESKTGLTLDESAPSYIHSGAGDSYVRYVHVEKGQIYYLLLDNVRNNGKGHIIHFHYKILGKDELYAGMQIPFEQIRFKDGDTEFRTGAQKGLDSLYTFLVKHPSVKIEIQGHVNARNGNHPMPIPGKPTYTILQLSEQRALAICKYLTDKGIAADRMTTVGYGNTRMKFPNPKTKKEAIANARAEILITSLDYKGK